MKSKLTKIPIQQLSSGDTLSVLVHEFNGQPGPKIYIQANIHGPEVAGSAVVLELIKALESQETINGSVILVVSANPIGLNTKIGGFPAGYINHNGESSSNWNRIFLNLVSDIEIENFITDNKNLSSEKLLSLYKKYLEEKLFKIETDSKYGLSIEKKLAITLQKLSNDADFVVDLHSAGYNQMHIYTFLEIINSAKFFGIQNILKLPFEFTGAFDEAFYLPWLKLAEIYKEIIGKDLLINKEVFTVELENDNEISSVKTKKYLEMLINYLQSKEILSGKAILPKLDFQVCDQRDYVKYFAPVGGLVETLVVPGQKVSKGTPFLTITPLDNATSEKITLMAEEDCIINSFPLSKVISEGEPVIGILKNLKKV